MGEYAADTSSSVCTSCPYPRSTAGKGATSCNACERSHYITDSLNGKRESGLKRRLGEDRRCFADPEGGEHACCECPQESTQCDQVGTSIATIGLRPDYYRYGPTSVEIWSCDDDGACIGSPAHNSSRGRSADPYCLKGTHGPLCHVCENAYYRDTFTRECKRRDPFLSIKTCDVRPHVPSTYRVASVDRYPSPRPPPPPNHRHH